MAFCKISLRKNQFSIDHWRHPGSLEQFCTAWRYVTVIIMIEICADSPYITCFYVNLLKRRRA